MSGFKHHSCFRKEKHVQRLLFPHVCFHCRKSFKKPQNQEPRLCPQCGGELVLLSRKFSAPKKSDIGQWKKVQFLVAHGFHFQSVFEFREEGGQCRVSYPKSLQEAKEFVVVHGKRAAM